MAVNFSGRHPGDRKFLGSDAKARQRVSAIFDNRGLTANNRRINRIANEVRSGQRTFDSVRDALAPFANTSPFGNKSQQVQGSKVAERQGSPKLPALSAEQLRALAERRRTATRNLQQAVARRQRDAGRAESQAALSMEDIGAKADRRAAQLMAELGDKGAAFQPRFAGKGNRAIRDTEARQRADVQSELANRLAALDELVANARANRDRELADVDADRVRMRTRLSDILQEVGA